MTTAWTERALTGAEAAILRHPDQATPWAPSIVVRLAPGGLDRAVAAERLEALAARHAILAARLDLAASRWRTGGPPALEVLGDELQLLRTRFALADAPPLRVALSPGGDALAIVGHHAALDGRALVMVARGLLGAEPVEAASAREAAGGGAEAPPAAASGAGEALRRLARPADRVARSQETVDGEAFVAAELAPGSRVRAASLARAAVAAVTAWNHDRGERWSQIGLSIPVGGPPVLGNVASHRRVDLAVTDDPAAAVRAALRAQAAPPEAALTPAKARVLRIVAPVLGRLSDSLLVSNLGLVDLPGARAIDFYPQARGRSAVAIGACTPAGGLARITLRARDLSQFDAGLLLGTVVDELLRAPSGAPSPESA